VLNLANFCVDKLAVLDGIKIFCHHARMRIFSPVLAILRSVDPNLLIALGCVALVVLFGLLFFLSWKLWLTHQERMFALEHFDEVKADGLAARKPRAK
jgi:hypothetical protein